LIALRRASSLAIDEPPTIKVQAPPNAVATTMT
jgi:hypothetical protein